MCLSLDCCADSASFQPQAGLKAGLKTILAAFHEHRGLLQVNGWPASILTWLLTFIIAGLNTYLIIMSIKNNEFGSTTGV